MSKVVDIISKLFKFETVEDDAEEHNFIFKVYLREAKMYSQPHFTFSLRAANQREAEKLLIRLLRDSLFLRAESKDSIVFIKKELISCVMIEGVQS